MKKIPEYCNPHKMVVYRLYAVLGSPFPLLCRKRPLIGENRRKIICTCIKMKYICNKLEPLV